MSLENNSPRVLDRLQRLAVSTVGGISMIYAGAARFLIGRAEDFSDLQAAWRLRRLNSAAARQQVSQTRTTRSRN